MADRERSAEKAAKQEENNRQYAEKIASLPEFEAWPKISRLNRDITITEKIDGTNAAIGVRLVSVDVTMEGGSEQWMDGYEVYAQSRTRIITPENDNMGFARWVSENSHILANLGEGLHFGEWWGQGIQRGYNQTGKRFSLFNTQRWTRPDQYETIQSMKNQGLAIDVVPVLYQGPWTGVLGYKVNDEARSDHGQWMDLAAQADWEEVNSDAILQKVAIQRFLDRIVELGGLVDDSMEQQLRSLAAPINPRPRFAPSFILEHLKRTGSVVAPGYTNPEGIVIFHKASGTSFKVTVEKDEKHKGEQ